MISLKRVALTLNEDIKLEILCPCTTYFNRLFTVFPSTTIALEKPRTIKLEDSRYIYPLIPLAEVDKHYQKFMEAARSIMGKTEQVEKEKEKKISPRKIWHFSKDPFRL